MPGSGVGVSNVKRFKEAGFTSLHLSGRKDGTSLSIPEGINQELSFLHQSIQESETETLRQVVQVFKSS
jgi:copper homeostasis protein CutC